MIRQAIYWSWLWWAWEFLPSTNCRPCNPFTNFRFCNRFLLLFTTIDSGMSLSFFCCCRMDVKNVCKYLIKHRDLSNSILLCPIFSAQKGETLCSIGISSHNPFPWLNGTILSTVPWIINAGHLVDREEIIFVRYHILIFGD